MKKISLLLSALLLTVSLASCSGKSAKNAPASDASATEDLAIANAVQEVENPSEIKDVVSQKKEKILYVTPNNGARRFGTYKKRHTIYH